MSLSVGVDSQFDQLIEGVHALHNKMEKEIQYEIDQTLLNVGQNLPFDHHVYAHGMISAHADKTVMVPKGTVLRSFQSVYKTAHDAYIHPLKIIGVSTFNEFGSYNICIRLEITGIATLNEVQFFVSSEVIDCIFGNKKTLTISGPFNEELILTKQNPFNLFTNLNYKFLSYFTVRGIKNTFGYVVLNIPLTRAISHINITINNIIVVNQFETKANIHNGMIEQNPHYSVIKVLEVQGNSEIVEPIYKSYNGWFLQRRNGEFFIDSAVACKFATVECENNEINTQYCKFQEIIPVRECSWKILPQKPRIEAKAIDYIRYLNGSPKYMLECLLHTSRIAYHSVEEQSTVLTTQINDKLVCSMGYKLTVYVNEINLLLMRKVIDELSKYHLCEVKIRSDQEYLL